MCRKPVSFLIIALLQLALPAVYAQRGSIRVTEKAEKGSFALLAAGKAASIVTDAADAEVTQIAAAALSDDIATLTGIKPVLLHEAAPAKPSIVIGTLGRSAMIDRLASLGLIQTDSVKGKWETFSITVTSNPLNKTGRMLVIFGSDPRGTAFGVFELSKMLGVSPWVWWADVTPARRQNLYISGGAGIIGPPSVKYRGFFINDEDWGMRPWAAKNMDKDLKDIGPKTYERVFELMLRLKANYLWPAMHPGTKAFWYYKENPELARKYAIIMGSSHHEPMLRDTEFEWNENYKEEYGKDHGEWRYDTNRDEIYRFFDDRVKQAVNNEAIYTVGMRATKDGGMPGPSATEGKVKILEQVIHDQREILEKRLKKPANEVPQVFCPYKEVLDLYRAGLKVPEDVTITWVDDNHGYIRQLPDEEEQKRSGGSGVYYHFSYWGLPQDYLWLCSTSPVLTSFEMSKAYDQNARTIWVYNVGDIKPAELELQFGMDLAWNVKAWGPEKAHSYPAYWASETFGKEFGERIGRIKETYYRLAASAKPEHLNWVSFTPDEIQTRLKEYQQLAAEAHRLAREIPERLQVAYFELIDYPVQAACSMNEKMLYARESLRLMNSNQALAREYAAKAEKAYENIQTLTKKYNAEIAGGKWNGMMDAHPRGREIFNMPKVAPAETPADGTAGKTETVPSEFVLPAARYIKSNPGSKQLKLVPGLGYTGEGLAVLPLMIKTFSEKDISNAPYADFKLPVKKGNNKIEVRCLPTFPLNPGMLLRYALSVNGSKPEFVNIASLAETKEWSSNVLRGFSKGNSIYQSNRDEEVTVRVYFPDPGLVVNALGVTYSDN